MRLIGKVKVMNKPVKTVRIVTVIIVMIAAICGIALYFLSPDEVSAEAVTRSDVSESISEIGTIICDDPITVYSPVAGRIEEVRYAVNDTVPAGSSLVVYDLTDFENTIANLSLNVDYHEDGYNAAVADNDKNKRTASAAGSDVDTLKQQYAETEASINQIEVDQAEKNQYVQATIQGIEAAVANMNTELELLTKNENASQEEINRLRDKISASRDAMATLPVNGMTAEESTKYSELKRQLDLIEREWSENLNKKTAAEEKIVGEEHIEQLSDSLEMARLELEKAETNLEKAMAGVTCDVEAMVTERLVDDGAYVDAGTALMVLQPLSGYRVSVKISRYDIDDIEIGQEAEITVGNSVYAGHVDRIVQVAVNDTSGKPKVRVDVAFDDEVSALPIGIEAEVTIYVASEEGVLSVPESSVYYGDEGDYVYIVNGGRIEKHEVLTGISGQGMVSIEAGLGEGETVITSPVSEDDIGSRIRISDSE